MLSSVFDRKGEEMRDVFLEGTFGSSDPQRSKSRPLTFVLGAASCSALIKLCKHPNHGAASARINPTSFLPSYFVGCVIPHIIPLKPYHTTVFLFFFLLLHLMTLKASLIQISAYEQECAVIAAG